MESDEIKFKLNEKVVINILKSMNHARDMSMVSMIVMVDDGVLEVPIEERFTWDSLVAIMMNFYGVTLKTIMK